LKSRKGEERKLSGKFTIKDKKKKRKKKREGKVKRGQEAVQLQNLKG